MISKCKQKTWQRHLVFCRTAALVAKYFLVTFIAEKCNTISLIHAITLKQQFKNRYMVVCYSNSNMDTIAVGEITYLLRILKYLTSFPCKHIYGLVWVFFLFLIYTRISKYLSIYGELTKLIRWWLIKQTNVCRSHNTYLLHIQKAID